MKSFAFALAYTSLLVLPVAPALADPAACANAANQLADLLDGPMKHIGREAEVTAEFGVDAQGHVQAMQVQGLRSYRTPVRMAIELLDCQAGTPQRYVVSIRFVDPARHSVVAAPPVTVALAASTPR